MFTFTKRKLTTAFVIEGSSNGGRPKWASIAAGIELTFELGDDENEPFAL